MEPWRQAAIAHGKSCDDEREHRDEDEGPDAEEGEADREERGRWAGVRHDQGCQGEGDEHVHGGRDEPRAIDALESGG